jgi:hypothetical protein
MLAFYINDLSPDLATKSRLINGVRVLSTIWGKDVYDTTRAQILSCRQYSTRLESHKQILPEETLPRVCCLAFT